MKNLKKALALLLIAAMAMSLLCVGVFADDPGYTITITDTKGTAANAFEAYQVFAGDLSGDTLSNITWGSGVTPDADGKITINGTAYTAKEAAEALAAGTITTDVFSAAIVTKLSTTKYTGTADSAKANAVITVPEVGYYFVQNTGAAGEGEAYTKYILQVVKSVTVAAKADAPKVEKKVKDTNDSVANSTTGWQDSADYDIGDEIPYQITATLGDLSHYNTYNVKLTDTMTHLTLKNGSVAITIDDVDKTDDFTTAWDATAKTLTVSCADVKALGATTNSKIVVTYIATLDAEAIIGSTGNPNEVYLEYSNNPNGEGTGKTTKDKNIVFTYKVTVDKVKNSVDGEALKGAGFTLYKKNTSGEYVAIGEEIKGADMTTFFWKGVDDGDYKLVESTTPAGYNTIPPVEFTIAATHDTTADDPKLTDLTGKLADGVALFERKTDADGDDALYTKIVNQAGSTLPTTGGVGTTLFYVFGVILVLGAGVLLVTKKRMAHE